jgi:hypothetical protein
MINLEVPQSETSEGPAAKPVFPPRVGTRERRFTVLDMMAVVGLTALSLTAVTHVARASLPSEVRILLAGISIVSTFMLLGAWQLAGVRPGDVSRARDTLLGVSFVALSLSLLILVMVQFLVDPVTAVLTGLSLVGLLVYLITWS